MNASMTPTEHQVDWLDELECALLALDDAPVECDGMTYALSLLLTDAGIPHHAYCGYVRDSRRQAVVSPHCWIALDSGDILDLRLRMWLGDHDEIPHGVVLVRDQAWLEYRGHRIDGAPLSRSILSVMTDGRSDQVRLPPPPQENRHGT